MSKKNDTIAEKKIFYSWMIRLFIFIVLVSVAVIFFYSEVLREPLSKVIRRSDGSHGVLVPFISAYFIWLKRKELQELKPDFAVLPGILIAVIGISLLCIGKSVNELILLPVLSFWALSVGLFTGIFGTRITKVLIFPIFLLIGGMPFQRSWYNVLGEWWRDIGITSVWVLQQLGVSIYREGYNVFLPNCDVKVVHGCSGIRYLFPYFILGLAYAYLYKKTTKSRVLFVLAAIPLSLVASFFRLFFVFLGVYWFGCFMAGKPHIWISWAVFIGVLIVAVWADMFFSRKRSVKAESKT